jgi:hypothetical protein
MYISEDIAVPAEDVAVLNTGEVALHFPCTVFSYSSLLKW